MRAFALNWLQQQNDEMAFKYLTGQTSDSPYPMAVLQPHHERQLTVIEAIERDGYVETVIGTHPG